MLPNEGVMAFHELKAKKYFPVHWGMFELALHPWYDPIETLYKFSQEQNFSLLAPKIGQITNVNKDSFSEKWWQEEKLAMIELLPSTGAN